MMSLSSQDIMVGLMVTQANMVGQRELKTTYNNTTSPLSNIYTINLSRSRYSEVAMSLVLDWRWIFDVFIV